MLMNAFSLDNSHFTALAPFFIELVFFGTWTDARKAILQDAAYRKCHSRAKCESNDAQLILFIFDHATLAALATVIPRSDCSISNTSV